MRRVLALTLGILLVLLPVARADPNDPRDLLSVSHLIKVVSSPQLAPGNSGAFVFNFTNPYDFPMQNVTLNVSIYRYATIEETAPVDASWRWAYPRLEAPAPAMCTARECRLHVGSPIDRLNVNETLREQVTVLTSADMPHGTVFAQSSYFLRLWLEFDFNNGTAQGRVTFASRGYFTDQQWQEARTNRGPGCGPFNSTNRCLGSLNLTVLGVDGLVPDASFGVKEPFPVWPFYGLLVLVVVFLILAFLFWVEENPGRYPRIERAWLGLKGKIRRIVRLPRIRKA
ncbi:MAG: hypothetical protein E6K10_05315 [Methanobacteriota archaeon]|nr:MAG: hypothetical protein E6K10_05315 [Euryarchaeota archaeon]